MPLIKCGFCYREHGNWKASSGRWKCGSCGEYRRAKSNRTDIMWSLERQKEIRFEMEMEQ
jgi:hypothetical protein